MNEFLPPKSIITVTGDATVSLYGSTGLEACLHALFQRMQTACRRNSTNGMTFFDQGHDEYMTAYRRARVHLPTGSMFGMMGGTRNAAMRNFFKDANFKDSKHSLFVQAADSVAYAATMLRASEAGTLLSWQQAGGLGEAYDEIPKELLNQKAAWSDPRGIVRLK